MRAVVTGGAGFIGSHVVDLLVAAGHDVVVVDDLSSGSLANLAAARASHPDQVTVLEVDICDPAAQEAVAQASPEVVFHLAAQADVRVSVADPVRDARVNVIGLLHVLEGARSAGARKIVFASSGGTIYGDPDPSLLPLDETVAQHPLSPYGVTKKVGGDYLRSYRSLHGLDYVALALSNVYGPRQDPHGEAGVVAIFAGRLLTGEPCTVFGTGEQTRDYVYVDDVAAAFVAAASAGEGVVLNIGTGRETSVNELYASMARAAGSTLEPVRAPRRPGELERSALSPESASAILGWEPVVDLDEGTTRVLAWFREREPS